MTSERKVINSLNRKAINFGAHIQIKTQYPSISISPMKYCLHNINYRLLDNQQNKHNNM